MEECNESFKCLFKNIIILYKTNQPNPTQPNLSNYQTTNGNSNPETD
jgi:hypothetical protein